MRPLCIDLFAGLGGWAEGFLAESYDVIGFDIERHNYGNGGYPGQLVIQDVRTLHGSQFKDARVIVASPPCQTYSYMAMPWTRAKAMATEIRQSAIKWAELNELFVACFRIAQEAGVRLIVENVCGAQPWVGPARWHYGSFYLWGDVPALMPIASRLRKSMHQPLCETPEGVGSTSWFHGNSKHEGRFYGTKVPGLNWNGSDKLGYVAKAFNTTAEQSIKNDGGSWFAIANNTKSGHSQNPVTGLKNARNCWSDGQHNLSATTSSHSNARKAASAQIAKIPFPLARHIARCFKPY